MESSTVLLIMLYALAGVVFGSYAMRVADAKGYSGVAWFAGGFFFTIVALIAVAGLPAGGGSTRGGSDSGEHEESVQDFLARMAAEKAAKAEQSNDR